MANIAPQWNEPSGPIAWINCVYPISGTYGLLPRLLYYVTLVFAIFGRRNEWLIIGALVSALTYAGTAAIHMMTLVRNKSGVYDLDIVAAWAVLSTGALAYIGILHWSSTMRNSKGWLVMLCWGVLVGVALIFGRSILFSTPLSDPEPACYSTSGQLLEYPVQLSDPQFKCTYQCFSYTRPLRYQSEIMAVPRRMLDNQYTRLAYVLVGPIQFAAYAAMSLDAKGHTPSQACTKWVMAYLIRPGHREQFTRSVYNASMHSWYGGYFAMLGYVRRIKWSRNKMLMYTFGIPWMFLSLVIDILCLPMMVCNVILNEITLLSGGLPTNEGYAAVGQWGPLVGSALVVIAALIQKGVELYERRKKMKKMDSVVDGMRVSPDIEQGMMDEKDGEQEIGVVKPELAHVQTLQEMEVVTKTKHPTTRPR